MNKLHITQTTTLTVNYYKEVTTDDCERNTERIVDLICEMLRNAYSDRDFDFDWKKGMFDGDYDITITEEGTVKYYPSNSWYDPDEYDDPTTLDECDFEEIAKEVRTKYYGNDDIVASINVTSDWEVD